jgi:restriction system protein
VTVPRYDELFDAVLSALRSLGGSATNTELDDRVAADLGLTDDDLAVSNGKGRGQFSYNLAWTKSYLKAVDLVQNSRRGVWSLTELGRRTGKVDTADIKRKVRRDHADRRRSGRGGVPAPESQPGIERTEPELEIEAAEAWRDRLMDRILALDSSAFERLAKRLLRESGFVEVEVTGRSGDGGVDGTGVLRLGGLITFPVLFQCKRWQGTVGSREVRDLRGAMQGRAEHGLIITSGTFSREAREEANRQGAPPVDLVDGQSLLDKLKELQLGVSVREVEEVEIAPAFFDGL